MSRQTPFNQPISKPTEILGMLNMTRSELDRLMSNQHITITNKQNLTKLDILKIRAVHLFPNVGHDLEHLTAAIETALPNQLCQPLTVKHGVITITVDLTIGRNSHLYNLIYYDGHPNPI